MKKTLILLFLLLATPASAKIITFHTQNGNTVDLTVDFAKTEQEKGMGLMFKDKIPQNYGLVFLFNRKENIYMWMKNTKIPLDMIFLDETKTIVHIIKNTTPMSEKILSSVVPATTVIEVNAGFTDKHNIVVGDKVN